VWVDLATAHRGSDVASDATLAFVGAHGQAPVPAGQQGRLRLTGEVIGRLHHWERSSAGAWFGIVDYSVPFIGDFRPAKVVDCGLVPAAALRPRETTLDQHREPATN
jgi:hypothetical protein